MATVSIKTSGGRGPKIKTNISKEKVIKKIIYINEGLNSFWSNPKRGTPIQAAELLNKSRLDWQVSLSKCLKLWIDKSSSNDSGYLILAWTNLGSLVEGSMKLFLSVYYETYKKDINCLKKKGKTKDPDDISLDPLRIFFKKSVWNNETDEKEWDDWLIHIRDRRNAIHAYKNRNIGTFDEFFKDVHKYLLFLDNLNDMLPYPF